MLYTDGITEAAADGHGAAAGTLFGTSRLDNLLLACSDCDTDACIAAIRNAVAEFCNYAPPTDDQTMIAIRCL